MRNVTGNKDATDNPFGTIEQLLFDTGTEINLVVFEGFINSRKVGVRFLLEKENPANGITREFIVIAVTVEVPDAGINWPNVGIE